MSVSTSARLPHLSLTPPSPCPPSSCGSAKGSAAPDTFFAAPPVPTAAEAAVARSRSIVPHGLIFNANDDTVQPVPLQNVSVAAKTLDFVAYVTVTQRYVNTSSRTINCRYTFPIDRSAAVNRLHLTVNDRVIEGVVMEKSRAKETYKAAVRQGAHAALVEESEDSTDVFQASVGNIGAGEVVVLRLSYVTELVTDGADGAVRFVLPTTVAPRFNLNNDGAGDGADAPPPPLPPGWIDMPIPEPFPLPMPIVDDPVVIPFSPYFANDDVPEPLGSPEFDAHDRSSGVAAARCVFVRRPITFVGLTLGGC